MAFQGKCAIVTGGSRGIGFEVVKIILKKLGSVAILDISPTDKFQWPKFDSKTQKLEYIQCDVSDRQQLIDSFKKAQEILGGQLDIVVNNAAVLDEVNWPQMMETNLNAIVRGTYLGINLMSKEKGGRGGVIINTSSVAGIQNHHFLTYGAAKSGVIAFTSNFKMIPHFYEDHGIRINCVCPGWVDTAMGHMSGLSEERDKCGTSLDLPMLSLLTKMEEGLGVHLVSQEPNKTYPMLSPAQVAEKYEEIIGNETLHGETLVFSKEDEKWNVYQQTS